MERELVSDDMIRTAVDGFNEAAADGELFLSSLRDMERMRFALKDALTTLSAREDGWQPITESLISQLPSDHDGRNTWLMNHGKGDESEWLRDEYKRMRVVWDEYRQGDRMPVRRKYVAPKAPTAGEGQ